MKSNYDIIQFPKDIPINIQILRSDISSVHWHATTELLFILNGQVHVVIDDQTFDLVKEDVCIINPNSNHTIYGENYEILSISIQLNMLKFSDTHRFYFNLNSTKDTHNIKYDYIRQLIAQLVKVSTSGENRYMSISILYALLSHLVDNFQVSAPLHLDYSDKAKRIYEILKYVENHYRENIQLNELANQFSLTSSYLSSYFKKTTGQTFLDYYNKLRLSSAVNEMLTTDTSLESIALSNGFSDYRSFTKAFKKIYNLLPNQYRNKHTTKNANPLSESDTIVSKPLKNSDSLKSLSKYLKQESYESMNFLHHSVNQKILQIDGGTIDYSQEGYLLSHTFKNICTVGSAKQILYSEIQDMLKTLQNDIGFKFIKFHGILSDEMMVYYEDEYTNPSYSFTLVDKVIDFLLSINLRPFVQLSFMPIALASDPTHMIDMWHFNTSPPKNLEKWDQLIHNFLTHLIERYGLDEVKGWPFCVWNEPDGSTDSFGWKSPEEFYDFYRHTFNVVKSICSDIQFGTPSLLIDPNKEQQWTLKFLNYSKANQCTSDFLNLHYYDNDFSNNSLSVSEAFSLSNLAKPCPMNENPFAFTEFINDIKRNQRQLMIENFPTFLTEWNLTVSQRDLINDTCFKSCYITKNLLENYDRLNSFGYWVLSDFIEELPLHSELFHGGLGLFTYNGIPKAHYNAFKLINKLEDTLISKGNGYFITKSHNKISAILYNYEHFSKLFATGILFDISTDNRYAPFAEKNTALFQFNITNIPYKGALITEHIINQENGSSYDAWVKMGARSPLRVSDFDTLKKFSFPGLHVHYEKIIDSKLPLNLTLEPLEVRLVEIELM
jgi:xylan 1,4-beta-xylosidase